MILIDMYTMTDDNQDLYLIFEFNDRRLAFECPIGASVSELISILQQFTAKTKFIFSKELTVH